MGRRWSGERGIVRRGIVAGCLVAMSQWTVAHRAFAVEAYFANNNSVNVARRKFCSHFDIRRLNDGPSNQLIWAWVKKFRKTGSVQNKPRAGPSTSVTSPENAELVRREILQNPRKSIRKIAASTGVKKTSVHKIIRKQLKFHPYKLQVTQQLKEDDFIKRKNYAEVILERFSTPTRLCNIFFSDEAHFHIGGYVNKQNMRYWSAYNPKEIHERPLHCPKTTVWCAISGNGIIGPYFFGRGETVNAERYCAMLDNFFIPELHQHVSYNNRTHFQQDGATAHTARVTMTKVKELFPGKLISRFGDIPWPPRSPDLSPCDFFLWGYLKSRVYSDSPSTIQALQANIEREIAAISPELCKRVFTNMKERLQECAQREGRHLSGVIFKK